MPLLYTRSTLRLRLRLRLIKLLRLSLGRLDLGESWQLKSSMGISIEYHPIIAQLM